MQPKRCAASDDDALLDREQQPASATATVERTMTRRGRRQKVAANAPSVTHRAGDLQADVEQLRRELAAAQRQLEEVAHSGADAYAKRRMEVLDEARLVARGQALEA